MLPAALVVAALLAAPSARAASPDPPDEPETVDPSGPAGPAPEGDPLAAFAGEPSVAELQRAAIRAERLEPERTEGWLRRARAAALAPSLHLRVGHNGGALRAITDYDGTTRLTLGDRDYWTFEVAATWGLDRLVWNPDEIRVAREAQRMAARREKLLAEVAALHAERRRLLAALALTPPARPMERVEARLRIEELTAVLDGLTGGALSGRHQRRRAPPPARFEGDPQPGAAETDRVHAAD